MPFLFDVIIMFFAEVFTPSVIVVVEKRHSNVPSLNKFIISFWMYLGIRLLLLCKKIEKTLILK